TGILDHVGVYDGQYLGIVVLSPVGAGETKVTAQDSIAAGNASDGFSVEASPPASASLTLIRSTSANNGGAGIRASANGAGKALLRVGQSTIPGNASSWSSNGSLQSYGDNNIIANGDGDPAIPTVVGKK